MFPSKELLEIDIVFKIVYLLLLRTLRFLQKNC